ncbi:MAG: CCA tRNA nucleotidyltransferase [Arcobacteraceae bacterium]|nr:CCA tRNA nucleotidyltransferase [Arcobacteraceae bacterium]
MIDTLPKNLTIVLDNIVLYGGKPIVVGGSVRDYLLNISCSDYDIEVYGISTLEILENILKNFGTVNFVGKSFGILKLIIRDVVYDFSFPRTENKIGLGHKEFSVIVNSDLSFEDASRRRDFTMNSIGYDYTKKEFLDPYNGTKDIKNKLLKHIDDKSFIEDPLRVYRAIQFCGRFELTIDKNTQKLCDNLVKSEEFKTLSKERVFNEYEKLLLYSKKPSIGLQLLVQLNIINISAEMMNNIDYMVKYKTKNYKENLVLMFYFLFDTLLDISENKQLLKDIKKLQKFKVPEIYKKELIDIKNEAELISKKYKIMNNMPKPFLMGKDLINFGYKPSVKFGVVLKKIYQSQLDGEIGSKKEAEKLLSTLL